MFSFYLQKILKNLYLRVLAVFVLLALLLLLIYGNRIVLLNYFDQKFHGQLYDVPATYAQKKYGFQENPRMAQRLINSGLLKLSRYALSFYQLPKPKLLLTKAASLEKDWTQLVQPQALNAIDMLFSDMSLFCAPVFSLATIRENWQKEERLKKRHRIARKGKSSTYALDAEKYTRVRDYLLNWNQNYLELAAQKKPDIPAVASLRSDLFTALCLPSRSPQFWLSGATYLEYKTEQKLAARNPDLKTKPDQIYFLSQTELRNDSRYLLFLKNFFSHASRYGGNLNWQLEQGWDDYLFSHDKYYFKKYLNALLSKLKSSGKDEHCKAYQKLYAINYKGIEKEFLYTYALAKSAYGCGQYKKAQSIINHIIKQKFYNSQEEYRLARHLQFLLRLD